MRILSTQEEREELLNRLGRAPNTPEVEVAIRIVEEAIAFAELRVMIVNLFEAHDTPNTFEKIVESHYIHHEMRPFINAIDDLYNNTRLQRFKQFYGYSQSKIDEEGYTVI